jgi:hypothetical protein
MSQWTLTPLDWQLSSPVPWDWPKQQLPKKNPTTASGWAGTSTSLGAATVASEMPGSAGPLGIMLSFQKVYGRGSNLSSCHFGGNPRSWHQDNCSCFETIWLLERFESSHQCPKGTSDQLWTPWKRLIPIRGNHCKNVMVDTPNEPQEFLAMPASDEFYMTLPTVTQDSSGTPTLLEGHWEFQEAAGRDQTIERRNCREL